MMMIMMIEVCRGRGEVFQLRECGGMWVRGSAGLIKLQQAGDEWEWVGEVGGLTEGSV